VNQARGQVGQCAYAAQGRFQAISLEIAVQDAAKGIIQDVAGLLAILIGQPQR
jgi:hypothetical protein